MNLSKLLSARKNLLRQAHLANLAYSYFTVMRLSERITRTGLIGSVRLRAANVGEEIRPAALLAMDVNQSVLDEHFSDEDVDQLVDSIGFALESDFEEVEFNLDELMLDFGLPLQTALEHAGVTLDLLKPKPQRARRK